VLQPRSYPELIGKAFFLEPDPFLVMAHDDEPLAEGALLAASIGLLVGAAQVAGNLLQPLLAPAPTSADPFVQQTVRLNSADIGFWMADPLRAGMLSWHNIAGQETGWWQALLLVAIPVALILFWLLAGTLLWLVGRMLGGDGTLTQVLGAAALVVAPALFYVIHIIPFTYVNLLLPLTWGLLLYYRAAQMAHDLPWAKALGVTALCALLLVLGWLLLGAGTFLLAMAI
jgi:hypothetical protein